MSQEDKEKYQFDNGHQEKSESINELEQELFKKRQADEKDEYGDEEDLDDLKNYNMCYSYSCLIIISLVLIEFTWVRQIIGQLFGYSNPNNNVDHEGYYHIKDANPIESADPDPLAVNRVHSIKGLNK